MYAEQPGEYVEVPSAPPTADEQAIPYAEFTRRDWYVFQLGQQYGHQGRQWEIDAIENAYKQSEYEADRLYRIAFDHDNHDCNVHENRGPYKGAATRPLHWDYWPDEEDQLPPDPTR